MKLVLSVSGGVTGIPKESIVELNSLDVKTRDLLLEYFNKTPVPNANMNFMERWILDDNREVSVQRQRLPSQLQLLYDKMKKELKYIKNN